MVITVHSATLVMSCVVPSAKLPVAVNCWLPRARRPGKGGVTVMNVGGTTWMEAEPVTDADVAEMVEVPPPAASASPPPEMAATLLLAELQVTDDVRSFELPSL